MYRLGQKRVSAAFADNPGVALRLRAGKSSREYRVHLSPPHLLALAQSTLPEADSWSSPFKREGSRNPATDAAIRGACSKRLP